MFAVGVLAFEMFTGRVPFEGKSQQEMAINKIKGERLRLREVLPENLESVIDRALAPDPAERFQTMDELYAGFASLQ